MLAHSRTLEERLRGIITEKFDYFAPNRKLLGALSAHADPEHPLSPFSRETAAIREQDISFFERAVEESKVKLPGNIRPYLPRLLWLYQMGLILFWVYDRSPEQARTKILFDKTLKMLLVTLRLAAIPLLQTVAPAGRRSCWMLFMEISMRSIPWYRQRGSMDNKACGSCCPVEVGMWEVCWRGTFMNKATP